ncbi:MAG: FixH family protein [Blastocatellales bacterium]
MKTKTVVVALAILGALLFAAACRDASSSGSDKVIKSAKSGEMTIALSNSTGELKNGENELTLTFADASGKTVDVGAASLNFHMAAMGAMAEMNDRATLTTTETPGRYRAQVNLQMGGTWEAQVKYQGGHGTGQASMSVQAK